MTPGTWILAFSSVSISALAQLLMKTGMTEVGGAGLTGTALLFATSTDPYVIGGFAAYGVGALLWLKVLSQTDLSLAYPLVSMGFVLVALLSWLVLGEHLSVGRISGIVLIVAGVALIGGTAG